MIPIDSQNFESYVPVYDTVPEGWDDARPFIVEQLKKLATAVNSREIGFYLDEELLSGKAFIPGLNIVLDGGSSQLFRTVLRKVVDFGPLPNAGTKSVLHGIVFDANFTLVGGVIAATDPVGLKAILIPYAGVGSTQNIQFGMSSTTVDITTAVNLSNYTRCFITLEYLQEL